MLSILDHARLMDWGVCLQCTLYYYYLLIDSSELPKTNRNSCSICGGGHRSYRENGIRRILFFSVSSTAGPGRPGRRALEQQQQQPEPTTARRQRRRGGHSVTDGPVDRIDGTRLDGTTGRQRRRAAAAGRRQQFGWRQRIRSAFRPDHRAKCHRPGRTDGQFALPRPLPWQPNGESNTRVCRLATGQEFPLSTYKMGFDTFDGPFLMPIRLAFCF